MTHRYSTEIIDDDTINNIIKQLKMALFQRSKTKVIEEEQR